MDEMTLRKALSLLDSFTTQLPEADIEEKYVKMYHQLLSDIQNETKHDLSYFFIPPEELKPTDTAGTNAPFRRQGRSESRFSEERYCDRARFLIALKGVVNFINSFILYPKCAISLPKTT